MISEAVAVAIISMIGGVIVAYITNVAAKKVQEKRDSRKPKDRMEQMFDGYERLIKQLADEDERKAAVIVEQQNDIRQMKIKLAEMESKLEATQSELIESHRNKEKLTHELDRIRKLYKSTLK